MKNKKLTDNEIKKALECCGKLHIEHKDSFCNECIFKGKAMCIGHLCDYSIGLINRLQADCENYKQVAENQQKVTMERGFEIKRLTEKANRLQARLEKSENVERLADKTIATLQAENERLKNAYKQCAWERDIFAEDMKEEIKKDCSYLMLDIKTIKAEAYKEFAEIIIREYSETEYFVNNLLKELVGEDNDTQS